MTKFIFGVEHFTQKSLACLKLFGIPRAVLSYVLLGFYWNILYEKALKLKMDPQSYFQLNKNNFCRF